MSLHRKKHNYPCLQLHSGSGKKSKYAAAALAVANPLLDPRILCSLEKVDKARIAPIIAVELLVLCCLLNPRKLQNDTETLSSQLCYYSFCRVFRIARSCIIKSIIFLSQLYEFTLKSLMMNCIVIVLKRQISTDETGCLMNSLADVFLYKKIQFFFI